MTKKVDEITLGSYRRKANMASAGAAMNTAFGDPANKEKNQEIIRRREAGLARADARADRFKQQQADKAKADRDAADQADRENLPALMKQYQELVGKFKALGGDSYQYADRMMPRDREAEQVHRQLRVLQSRINKAGGKLSETFDAEYDDEAGMAHNSLETIYRATKGLAKTIKDGDNLPEWCQEKLSLAEDYLVTVWDYLQSEQGVAEGLPQTLRKVVPGYAKREIDKKMDAGTFGKTDADKDANFQRYKKIQDKIKEQGVAEGDVQEWKKGVKAPVKPRNFVAKNATVGGAGAHKDKKKAQKQGQTKHKKKPELAETATYERRLNVLFEMKKLTEEIKKTNK